MKLCPSLSAAPPSVRERRGLPCPWPYVINPKSAPPIEEVSAKRSLYSRARQTRFSAPHPGFQPLGVTPRSPLLPLPHRRIGALFPFVHILRRSNSFVETI